MDFDEYILDELSTKKKSDKFSIYIEQYALHNDLSLFEALSAIVEEHQIDYEVVKGMLSAPFLEKIELEVLGNPKAKALF